MEKDVLEQHQWTRQPGVAFRGFAQRGGELDQRRIHRQQQPEYGEVRGELGDREDDGENPEAERALEDAIVPDSRGVGLLELLEGLDLRLRVLPLVGGGLESIHFRSGFTNQPVESRASGLDLVLHLYANALPPLPEQLETFHPEHLFGLEDADAFDIVAWQSLFRPFSGELLRFLL